MKKAVCLLAAAGMLACFSGCGVFAAGRSTYRIVAEAFDWGAASTKAIVELGSAIAPSDLCDFSVTESNKRGPVGAREITGVYLCDENGNKIDGSSRYIAIEMRVDPSHGTLFYYNTHTYYNVWDDDYRLTITPVNATSEILKNMHVDPKYTGRITPQADLFGMSEFVYNGTAMDYALYSPAESTGKKPLVAGSTARGKGGTTYPSHFSAIKSPRLPGTRYRAYWGALTCSRRNALHTGRKIPRKRIVSAIDQTAPAAGKNPLRRLLTRPYRKTAI